MMASRRPVRRTPSSPFGSRVDQSVPSPLPTCALCGVALGGGEGISGGLGKVCGPCNEASLIATYGEPGSRRVPPGMVVLASPGALRRLELGGNPPASRQQAPKTREITRPEATPTRRRYDFG